VARNADERLLPAANGDLVATVLAVTIVIGESIDYWWWLPGIVVVDLTLLLEVLSSWY